MTPGGADPPRDSRNEDRSAPDLGWRANLARWQRALMRHPWALAGQDVLRAYDRAGGGMLAGGLSYFGFFTVVPALLLFVSVLGLLIGDAALRAQLIDDLVGQLDPIRDVAVVVINGLADSARTGTIIGILGLIWGGSGFYGALQGSMQRMFPGPGSRDFFRTRLNGVIAVALIVISMLAAVVIVFATPIIAQWLSERCADIANLNARLDSRYCQIDLAFVGDVLGPVVAVAVSFLAAVLVYVTIPPDGPSLRQAFVPAAMAGIGIGLLTSLFGWVAPILVRNFLALGVVGSVFISLIWFNLVFQILLYGAALARVRRDRDRLRQGPPTI